jgi:Uncharacterized protein conserved in bacteria (DUF2330)
MATHPSTPLRTALTLGCAALLAGASAHAACCYFAAQEKDISQPGQKAFITWHPDEDIESFTVQPKFEGNAVDFGMVIPTPSQPKLDEMPRDFFKDLAVYTILMPLPQPIWPQLVPISMEMAAGAGPPGSGPRMLKDGHGVTVLEAGVVGSLDYKIIVAEQASGLFDWLKDNGYSYSGDEKTLDFYIQKHWFFTVMKIDPKQMKKNPDGSYLGEVTPTRFTFETTACVYPLKITQISVPSQTDALFYVQAPQQMDLKGDWSWRHSFRVMYLTYMLGCSANEQQQRELEQRNRWVEQKKAQDPSFDTTKLDWARKLGDADMAILDLPLRNYAQMGGGDLPPGARVIPLKQFLDEVWADYLHQTWFWQRDNKYAKSQLDALQSQYPAEAGQIVKIANPGGPYTSTQYMWYPNREAPEADVKGLSRLKGHLQHGMWVTKFRKAFRKDEMTQDLDLVPVAEADQQEYVRLFPTSPP